MAPRQFVRSAVRDRFYEMLVGSSGLTDVDVHRSLAPARLERTSVVIFEAEQSGTGIRDLRAGRKSYRDEFEFDIGISAQDGFDTASAAEARCDELTGAVLDICADDPRLGGTINGLQYVEIVQYDGPASFSTESGGWAAHAVIRIRVCTETGTG